MSKHMFTSEAIKWARSIDASGIGHNKEKEIVLNLLGQVPEGSSGDFTPLFGFLISPKPACYVSKVEQEAMNEILLESKKIYPDAKIKKHLYGSSCLYSQRKIIARIKAESDFAETLGIRTDSIGVILEKSKKDQEVEGFILGFPESAIHTWKKLKVLDKRIPRPLGLLLEHSFSEFQRWDEVDKAKLLAFRDRLEKTQITVDGYIVHAEFRKFSEKIYKKYFNASQEDIDFLLSLAGQDTKTMNYIDSKLPGRWWESSNYA
ncbi:hypothetical protein HN748_02535 [Candidatus Peregrinibacteria bacterium]|nr:hypothetical protein [Candidatus Peregrinibacteria bacterium]MBT7703086.1 hypothetical protein [Candidatus Peregrinibacteria bacterium]